MPIINSAFETRLRSLKFQNEPLVSRDIPGVYETTLEGEALKAAVIARSGPEDALRLTRILSSPSGLAFIANQALLSSTTFSTNRTDQVSDYVRDTLQAAGFSPFIAPAQALVNGTGIRLGDEFRVKYVVEGDPIGSNGDKRTSRVNQEYDGYYKNSILNPYTLALKPTSDPKLKSYLPSGSLPANPDLISSLVDGQIVTGARSTTFPTNPNEPETRQSAVPTDGSSGKEISTINQQGEDKSRNTFLKVKSRLSLGTQGKKNTAGTPDAIDQVNFLGIQDAELGDTYDYIPFKIVIKAPEESDVYLYFRAYLTDFTDDYTGTWNGVNYIGRAEEFYTYNGFSRSIGFGFMVAASTEKELLPLYQKLNRLVSTTAPSYSNTFMRGVYTKVTIGDYLKDVPGFFKSFSLSWNQGYPWEVNSRERGTIEGDLKTPRVPHILNVGCGFQPVHSFSPQYKEPFILDQRYLDASVNV